MVLATCCELNEQTALCADIAGMGKVPIKFAGLTEVGTLLLNAANLALVKTETPFGRLGFH